MVELKYDASVRFVGISEHKSKGVLFLKYTRVFLCRLSTPVNFKRGGGTIMLL